MLGMIDVHLGPDRRVQEFLLGCGHQAGGVGYVGECAVNNRSVLPAQPVDQPDCEAAVAPSDRNLRSAQRSEEIPDIHDEQQRDRTAVT